MNNTPITLTGVKFYLVIIKAPAGAIMLALTRLNFVAAKIFLGFNVQRMSASDRVVLTKRDFFGRVLSVFSGVVGTVAGQFAD